MEQVLESLNALETENQTHRIEYKSGWEIRQRPLAEALLFPGCEIKSYDGLSYYKVGLYLQWKHGIHMINIDFGDAVTVDQVNGFEVSWFYIDDIGEMQFAELEDLETRQDVIRYCERRIESNIIPGRQEE